MKKTACMLCCVALCLISALVRSGEKGTETYIALNDQGARLEAMAAGALPSLEMVAIKAGHFMMGSPVTELGRTESEGRHSVRITQGFLMGRYEVTIADFRKFVAITGYRTEAEKEGWCWSWKAEKWVKGLGKNWQKPGFSQMDQEPVICISWYDAVAFCNWLSMEQGLKPAYQVRGQEVTWDRRADGYRLPTEAEWEYACRAGTETAFANGGIKETKCGHDTNLSRIGWYCGNSGLKTHPVGQKTENAWGLFDMHGNAWEWCWDVYGEYPADSVTDPTGSSGRAIRVLRGGGWLDEGRFCRAALRYLNAGNARSDNLGFRLVRTEQAGKGR